MKLIIPLLLILFVGGCGDECVTKDVDAQHAHDAYTRGVADGTRKADQAIYAKGKREGMAVVQQLVEREFNQDLRAMQVVCETLARLPRPIRNWVAGTNCDQPWPTGLTSVPIDYGSVAVPLGLALLLLLFGGWLTVALLRAATGLLAQTVATANGSARQRMMDELADEIAARRAAQADGIASRLAAAQRIWAQSQAVANAVLAAAHREAKRLAVSESAIGDVAQDISTLGREARATLKALQKAADKAAFERLFGSGEPSDEPRPPQR